MTYDCEINGCVNKTDGFLCEPHQDQAVKETNIIVVCENCNKILSIKERKDRLGPRYEFVKDCMRCRPETEPKTL